MNPYSEKLLSELPQREDGSILDMLYLCHRGLHPQDSPEVTELFSKLNDVLASLPLKDCDRVWDLACALCSCHEQGGFQEGVAVGMSLTLEIMKRKQAA